MLRCWRLYFDVKWNISKVNKQWISVIDPNCLQNIQCLHWIISKKNTLRNVRWMTYYTAITRSLFWIIFGIIFGIVDDIAIAVIYFCITFATTITMLTTTPSFKCKSMNNDVLLDDIMNTSFMGAS